MYVLLYVSSRWMFGWFTFKNLGTTASERHVTRIHSSTQMLARCNHGTVPRILYYQWTALSLCHLHSRSAMLTLQLNLFSSEVNDSVQLTIKPHTCATLNNYGITKHLLSYEQLNLTTQKYTDLLRRWTEPLVWDKHILSGLGLFYSHFAWKTARSKNKKRQT